MEMHVRKKGFGFASILPEMRPFYANKFRNVVRIYDVVNCSVQRCILFMYYIIHSIKNYYHFPNIPTNHTKKKLIFNQTI